MRRTPVNDRFDDQEDPPAPPPRVRRVSTTPPPELVSRGGEVRYIRGAQRAPVRRGPDPRVWFVRGSLGVAALAGLWLGLQALLPTTESRVSEAPTPTLAVDASTVGAPEPPPAVQAAPPAAQPAPTALSQPTAAPEGDRLPGLPTPAASSNAAPAGQTASAAPSDQPAATPIPAPRPEPPAQAEQPSQAPAPEPQPEPRSGPAGKPTAAPIPPPENQAPPAPVAAAPPPAPAPRQAAPPPAAQSSGGAFELAASASPASPISEQAQVTISVRATQNGAPLAGAFCMATVHYRTNTARQPNGGFTTNSSGVGSFVLDARGTTYGFFIPVDVTCNSRLGTVTTRTGFTPVKGR